MKKPMVFIAGLALGVIGTVAVVVALYAFGVIGISLPVTTTYAPPTAIAIPNPPAPVEATQPPTETATTTATPPSIRTPQPLTETATPTLTPSAKTCNHSKGVYVLISEESGQAVFESNDKCLMFSIDGLGQPVYGEKVEGEITILGRKYNPYYRYTCPIKSDRTASCGLYLEELLFTEFGQNNIGWAVEYKQGQYAHLMVFITKTPNP